MTPWKSTFFPQILTYGGISTTSMPYPPSLEFSIDILNREVTDIFLKSRTHLDNLKNMFISSGPPQSFCFLRQNGQYTNPDNEQQFFTCTDNFGSACQMCPGNLVFKAKCGRCLAVEIDCPMTTVKPTTAKLFTTVKTMTTKMTTEQKNTMKCKICVFLLNIPIILFRFSVKNQSFLVSNQVS